MSGRFTEEEARQIFARAAERQHTVRGKAEGEGLTADELEAIGAEAGLDPAHVAAAVAELRAAPAEAASPVFGIDPAPRRARVLPGELTDETWGRLVGRCRRTFGAAGLTSEYGRVREWTSGPSSNLHVLAEPVDDGTRLVFETRREDIAVPIWSLPAMGLFLSAMMLVMGVTQDKLDVPGIWLLALLGIVVAGVGGVGSHWALRRWSETRADQFEALLDEAEAMLSPASSESVTAGPSPASGHGEGRIDPALIDVDPPDPSEEAGAARTRERRRA